MIFRKAVHCRGIIPYRKTKGLHWVENMELAGAANFTLVSSRSGNRIFNEVGKYNHSVENRGVIFSDLAVFRGIFPVR